MDGELVTQQTLKGFLPVERIKTSLSALIFITEDLLLDIPGKAMPVISNRAESQHENIGDDQLHMCTKQTRSTISYINLLIELQGGGKV